MDDAHQERNRSSRTIWFVRSILLGVGFLLLAVLAWYWMQLGGVCAFIALAFGLEGAITTRIPMTSRRELRGARARGLGAAMVLYSVAMIALGLLSRHDRQNPISGPGGLPWLGLVAVLVPFLLLWALGLLWSTDRDRA
ncbi:MAG: hypothetical protein HY901_25795 [Deltaproteobacteria bacterium]|nr:hypothetical protein [Deltaproteobacteria bacterium]